MKEFINKYKIEKLKQLVRDTLIPHIDKDYVLLDVPNYRNIGDTLIWQGELEFLKEIPHKMLYTSNPFTFNESKIPKDAIILLQGGGNFGDVWPVNQLFRNNIIKKFPDNRIIIFPQTIHYENRENLLKDKELYSKHKDLIICVRDKISYEISKNNFINSTTYLLPDMAFFNDFSSYHNKSLKHKSLLMLREDKEMGDINVYNEVKNGLRSKGIIFEIKDWPGFYKLGSLKKKVQTLVNMSEIKGSELLMNTPFSFLVDDVSGLKRRDYKDHRIKIGIDFMNQYDAIYSTRLHGFILAVLLNKEVYIFDNSYGKNKNFFNEWLLDFDNVKLITI